MCYSKPACFLQTCFRLFRPWFIVPDWLPQMETEHRYVWCVSCFPFLRAAPIQLPVSSNVMNITTPFLCPMMSRQRYIELPHHMLHHCTQIPNSFFRWILPWMMWFGRFGSNYMRPTVFRPCLAQFALCIVRSNDVWTPIRSSVILQCFTICRLRFQWISDPKIRIQTNEHL